MNKTGFALLFCAPVLCAMALFVMALFVTPGMKAADGTPPQPDPAGMEKPSPDKRPARSDSWEFELTGLVSLGALGLFQSSKSKKKPAR